MMAPPNFFFYSQSANPNFFFWNDTLTVSSVTPSLPLPLLFLYLLIYFCLVDWTFNKGAEVFDLKRVWGQPVGAAVAAERRRVVEEEMDERDSDGPVEEEGGSCRGASCEPN